ELLFVLLYPATAGADATPRHPLDPLSAREIAAALELLARDGKLGEHTRFPYFMLKEPDKRSILAFRPGQPLHRQAQAVLYDTATSRTYDVTIDLTERRIAEYRERPGVQPAVMLSEFDAAPPIVKADPRFRAALERRGITDLDEVTVDIWAYGTPDDE